MFTRKRTSLFQAIFIYLAIQITLLPRSFPCLRIIQNLELTQLRRSIVINGTDSYSTLLSRFEDTSNKVYDVLNQVAAHSWEWGTQAQVLLERQYPCLSVYTKSNEFPLDKSSRISSQPKQLQALLDPIIARRTGKSMPIIEGDGSCADPASLGVGTLVASATAVLANQSDHYGKIATNQLQYLLAVAPRSKTGAISHRENEIEYWSDFMYMIPPFIAFEGAQTSNLTLLQIAFDQIRLYRDALTSTSGNSKLWRHIVPDTDASSTTSDPRLWSSGNGWASNGMMRVYATYMNLRDDELRAKTESWRAQLATWVSEVIIGAFSFQDSSTGLLPNVFDEKGSVPIVLDCSGTAAITASAYRLLSFEPSLSSNLPIDKIHKATLAIFQNYTNPQTGAVAPVVDPMNWNSNTPFDGSSPEAGSVSPEGQAFVLLMQEGLRSYLQSLQKEEHFPFNSAADPSCI